MQIFYPKQTIKTVLFVAILLITFWQPSKTQAKQLIFSDNFDDGDFSDWQVVRNRQWNNSSKPCMNYDQPAQWEIKDGALGIDIDGPGCVTEIIPNNFELPENLNFIYEFDWNFKSPATGDHNVIFLWKDKNNWYDFKVTNGQIWLQKVVGGRVYWLNPSRGYFSFQPNTNHHVEIILNNNKISLKIDDQEIINTTDTEPFVSGGLTLGLQASVGAISKSHSFFDNIKVYDLDKEDNLNIFKQTDERWKNIEYDHASDWSTNPTINRWGCALTSMATLLRHYGINNLPEENNQRPEINPDTLNKWLNAQPDGYLGKGLVNWISVTRLTRLVSELDQTPKLEYQYLPISDTNQPYKEAIDELNADRWVIANIPDHFVLVHDKNATGDDLAIYDPYYNVSWMSQHSNNNRPPKSYRKFIPSHTDLSYLVFAFSSDINLKVFNKDNTDITNQYLYTEQISDPENQNGIANINVVAIPKPETQNFSVKVSADKLKETELTIFAYDNQANLSDLSQKNLVVSTQPTGFKVNYKKDGSSTIQPGSTSVDDVIGQINEFTNSGKLPWRINFWLITYLDAWKNNNDDSLNETYKELNLKLLDWFKGDMDELVYKYLRQIINY